MSYVDTARRLMQTPTAPYREQWMLAALDGLLAEIPGLSVTRDEWGNVFARLRRGEVPPACVAYVAHLDHPGFVVEHVEGTQVHGTFEGGVDDSFFTDGRVRLFRAAGDPGIPARIVEVTERRKETQNRAVTLRASEEATGAVLGMWDLPVFVLGEDRLFSRAIDDLGGVAALVECLRGAAQRWEAVDLLCVFTRAEECGFRGTLAICESERAGDLVPLDAWVISIETSSARPATPVGGGAILRVGDKQTIFNPVVTRAIQLASKRLHEERGIAPLVRALMDGGTCEASAFNVYGWTSGGMCIPLGNYHNMNREDSVIDAEYISIKDAESLAASMIELAILGPEGAAGADELPAELHQLAEGGRTRLSEPAARV